MLAEKGSEVSFIWGGVNARTKCDPKQFLFNLYYLFGHPGTLSCQLLARQINQCVCV